MMASTPDGDSSTLEELISDSGSKILVTRLNGGIFGGTADYILRGVERAERKGIPFLLVMDTPGGALEATRDIVKAFLGAKVPILVWVGPAGARAGSAGVFITMAANVAVMAPSSNIGAAHPVGLGVGAPAEDGTPGAENRGARDEQEIMAQKIENDTLAFIESIAQARGRNAEWARAAVKHSAAVTSEKALELNVIDFLAPNLESMFEQLDGRVVQTAAGRVRLTTQDVDLIELEMSIRQTFLAFIGDPNLVYILFVIGMLGVYLEVNHPGLIFPAAIGGVCLLLAATGLSILPYNATGLVFMLIAGVCFVAETYVASFGLLTLGGAGCLVVGAILLFDNPPELENLSGLQMGISPWVYSSTALLSVAIVLPVAYVVARAQLKKPLGGSEGLVGEIGEALTEISTGDGRVFVHGENWSARSETHIEPGTAVVVDRVDGLMLHISRTEP